MYGRHSNRHLLVPTDTFWVSGPFGPLAPSQQATVFPLYKYSTLFINTQELTSILLNNLQTISPLSRISVVSNISLNGEWSVTHRLTNSRNTRAFKRSFKWSKQFYAALPG